MGQKCMDQILFSSKKEIGTYRKVVALAKSWIDAHPEEQLEDDVEYLLEIGRNPILISGTGQHTALLQICLFAVEKLKAISPAGTIDRDSKYYPDAVAWHYVRDRAVGRDVQPLLDAPIDIAKIKHATDEVQAKAQKDFEQNKAKLHKARIAKEYGFIVNRRTNRPL